MDKEKIEKIEEALVYLAKEIGRLSAYIGELRGEGRFAEFVESEIEERVDRVEKILKS